MNKQEMVAKIAGLNNEWMVNIRRAKELAAADKNDEANKILQGPQNAEIYNKINTAIDELTKSEKERIDVIVKEAKASASRAGTLVLVSLILAGLLGLGIAFFISLTPSMTALQRTRAPAVGSRRNPRWPRGTTAPGTRCPAGRAAPVAADVTAAATGVPTGLGAAAAAAVAAAVAGTAAAAADRVAPAASL